METEETITKGDRTRAEVLGAAHDLFVSNGYHGTSMRQIAERAGLALGGIYNHFGSKEQIFKEIIIKYHPIREILPLMESSEGETVDEMVHHFAHTLQDELAKRRDYLNLIFVEIVEFKGAHLPQIFMQVFPIGLKFAERMFRKRGELRTNEIPLVLAAFLGLMFTYFLFTSLIASRLRRPLVRLDLDKLVDIFLYGILVERPGKG
ncbi:MAG: TetR/AcrR family transcriptional regulator [Anaerolineae bacterium]|nr:MAG: TetR/AcrR family transcriptional regulator [Anaerolineae bacterium]